MGVVWRTEKENGEGQTRKEKGEGQTATKAFISLAKLELTKPGSKNRKKQQRGQEN